MKTLKKTRNRILLQRDKRLFQKNSRLTQYYSMVKGIPPKSRKKAKMPAFAIAIQQCTGISSQSNQGKKRIKGVQTVKRSKTSLICG